MNRFHVHVAVDDLEASIRFYSAVFGTERSVPQLTGEQLPRIC